jgi:GrpB-like predicted nucleotidyltransferase (UPF0157 family)
MTADMRTPLNAQSRPVIIVAYQQRWPVEFAQIGQRIRSVAGPAILRIDHIGSTAVAGLGAKDIIDLQVTVANLDTAGALTASLRMHGFRQGSEFAYDEFRGKSATDLELRKLYMREPEGERRVHIHIRELGRFNQRYALLFRDYLRASTAVRCEYEAFKQRAAQLFPYDIDGYLFLKDPVFRIIFEGATLWGQAVAWEPSGDFL